MTIQPSTFSSPPTLRGFRFHVLAALLLAALILLVFGESLGHNFAWDDHALIVQNEQITSPASWGSLWTSDFWKSTGCANVHERSFYRPMVTLSFMIDHTLWGLTPSGFHLTNLLLHWLCCVLVYCLALHFLPRPLWALLASLLFAVHPTHVENVAWIAGRGDILCAGFYLLTFLCFLHWTKPHRHGIAWQACIGTFYLASLFSKEMAISLPLVLTIYYSLLNRATHPWRRFAPLLTLLLALSAFYLFLRSNALGHLTDYASRSYLEVKLVLAPAVFVKYLGLLLGLVRVDPHHSEPLLGNLSFFFGLLCVGTTALFLLLAGWLCRRNQADTGFLLLWLPLTLLPVFNLGAIGDIAYADRFLYLPSAGGLLGFFSIPLLLRHLPTRHPLSSWAGYSAAGIMILTFAIVANSHVGYWKSNLTLFRHLRMTSPSSAFIAYNYGNSLMEQNDFESAAREYRTAINLEPEYPDPFLNLGVCLMHLEQFAEARVRLHQSLYLTPSVAAHNNLAFLYLSQGNLDAAIQHATQALQVPHHPPRRQEEITIRFNLARAWLQKKNIPEARQQAQLALALIRRQKNPSPDEETMAEKLKRLLQQNPTPP